VIIDQSINMKNLIAYHACIKYVLASLLALIQWNVLQAQNGSSEKLRTRISLNYFDLGHGNRQLKATLNAKTNDGYEKVTGAMIEFYQVVDESVEVALGQSTTNSDGVAIFDIPSAFFDTIAKNTPVVVLASFDGNGELKGSERSSEYLISEASLKFEADDEANYLKFILKFYDETDSLVPAENVNVRFFVRRMFGLLPVSEGFETTDGEGQLTLTFPEDIPGDGSGRLNIIAKVEDHETFGNILLEDYALWGTPLVESESFARTLWGARDNAPFYLLLLVNSLILLIWGVLVYIMSVLFKIRSLGESISA